MKCNSLASDKGNATVELKDTNWRLVDVEGKKTPTSDSDKQLYTLPPTSKAWFKVESKSGAYKQKNDELHFLQTGGARKRCLALRLVTELSGNSFFV